MTVIKIAIKSPAPPTHKANCLFDVFGGGALSR